MIGVAVLGVCHAAVIALASGGNAESGDGGERPNILWLTCEDLSPRFGCYGDSTAPTPNIDRLAREGVRYTHAFTATGVCAPCRHTIITGLYPQQSGAQYMRTMSRSSALGDLADPEARAAALERPLYEATPPAGVRCFPEYLREAGYYCTNNSKEDYQFTVPVTVWDESSPRAHYRNRPEGRPFFAMFNQTVTHESGVHGEGRSPRVVDRSTVPVPSFLPDTPAVREDLGRHYDNIIALDRWVGEMLDELEASGLADSTAVFFYSDHGDGLPRHKRWVYDSGTRVPMLVRWPDGRRAGEVEDDLVSFVDLAPTALALAGIERPDHLRGRVFCGPMREPAPSHVFMHRDRMDDSSFETTRSARGPRFRYVRNYHTDLPYLQPIPYRDRAATMGEVYRLRDAGELTDSQWQWLDQPKPAEELYDCEADPDQVVNLVDAPRHADELTELRDALDAWIAAIDDPLDTPEAEVVRTRVWPPAGEQPVTAAPWLKTVQLDGDRVRVTMGSSTEGASLGYRLAGDDADPNGPWNVYIGAFEIPKQPVEIVAHRLGLKPSRRTVELR